MSKEHRDLTRISHHTKIVATIGPASSDEETLEHMIRVGLNVVRFNFSHGDAAFHGENARKVREASRRVGREVAIVADLQGPKIRVGIIEGGKMELARGDKLILDAAYEGEGKNLRVGLDYRELPKDVKAGDILLLDDGLLTLKVEQVIGEEVHTIVQNPAVLKSKKGINKQGGGLTAPALTEKDYQDLKTAVAIGADYIAVSFVKSAADMELARQLVSQAEDRGEILPGLIAKIERVEAIENLEEIILASDGVMVARGDLAVEVGNPAVPALQKRIICTARRLRMITNPVPTRAEVSDVANAVLDGTDAVMLSAESAAGAYPFETVRTMAQICAAAEQAQVDLPFEHTFDEIPVERIDQGIANSAVFTALLLHAKAIVALTESGTTAFQISRFGINLPIHALTPSLAVQRKMSIYRSVRPARLDTSKEHDEAIREAEEYLVQRRHLKSGDLYVITSGSMRSAGGTDELHVRRTR